MKVKYNILLIFVLSLFTSMLIENKFSTNHISDSSSYLQKLSNSSKRFQQEKCRQDSFTKNNNNNFAANIVRSDDSPLQTTDINNISGYQSTISFDFEKLNETQLSLSLPINFWSKNNIHKYVFSNFANETLLELSKMHTSKGYNFQSYSESNLNNINIVHNQFKSLIINDTQNIYINLSIADNIDTSNSTFYSVVAIYSISDFYAHNNKIANEYINIINKAPKEHWTYYESLLKQINLMDQTNILQINSKINNFQNNIATIDNNYSFEKQSDNYITNILLLPNNNKIQNVQVDYNYYYLNVTKNNNFLSSDYTLSLSDVKNYNFKNGNSLDPKYNAITTPKTKISVVLALIVLVIILLITFLILYLWYYKYKWIEQSLDARKNKIK